MAELKVNLSAMLRNYDAFAEKSRVIPVLKGNAYGMGELPVLEALREHGVSLMACSRPEEALRLAGQGVDILLLCCEHDPKLLEKLVQAGVILAVESREQAETAAAFGPARVHIAVDTGFGRFGFRPEEIAEIRSLFAMEEISVEGIFSHFRSCDAAPQQFAVFSKVLEYLQDLPLGIRHIAASLNADKPEYSLDAVRIGTGLTGVLYGQEPVCRLTGRIVSIHELPKGSRIGYTSHKLKQDTRVAMMDVGTGDGAFIYRSFGPRTWLSLRKRRVQLGQLHEPLVLGHPGMTHTALDVTGIPCKLGDEVTVPQTPVLVNPLVPRVYFTEEQNG